MTLAMCGSISFIERMEAVQSELEKAGNTVFMPVKWPGFDYTDASIEERADLKSEHDLITEHYYKILKSDGIVVVNITKKNIENYIGGNTFLEMGFAFVNRRQIFVLNQLPAMPYSAEMQSMHPVILNGDLAVIDSYFDQLPRVAVASESNLKLQAVSNAGKKLTKGFFVKGFATESGVADEPSSFNEIYTGALNRINSLKKQKGDYLYYVAIESGLAKVIEGHGYFDVHVCIVENAAGVRKVALSGSVEIPKSITDLLPDTYTDLGVLVQKEFGVKEKDPITYISNGALNRRQVLEQLVTAALGMHQSSHPS